MFFVHKYIGLQKKNIGDAVLASLSVRHHISNMIYGLPHPNLQQKTQN